MTTTYGHELIVKGDAQVFLRMHNSLRGLCMKSNHDELASVNIDLQTALTVLQDDSYYQQMCFAGIQSFSRRSVLEHSPAIPDLDIFQDDSGSYRSRQERYVLPDSDERLSDRVRLLSLGFPELRLVYIMSYTLLQCEKQIYYYTQGTLTDHMHILYSSPGWDESRCRQAITIIRKTYRNSSSPGFRLYVDTTDDHPCWTF
jgi:hypothetical protein